MVNEIGALESRFVVVYVALPLALPTDFAGGGATAAGTTKRRAG
jgi:hypothetical protein